MEITTRKRKHVFRYYGNVYSWLRKLLNIPSNEMPLNLYWDKDSGEIVLETIED